MPLPVGSAPPDDKQVNIKCENKFVKKLASLVGLVNVESAFGGLFMDRIAT